MLKLSQVLNIAAVRNARFFQTSQIQLIDHEWRKKHRLAVNPNTETPLTYLPDFTYMDGRPTPLGQNQKRRAVHQRELTKKIVDGISEIDFAVKRHERIQKKQVQERQEVFDSKLKPKGHTLLKKRK